MCILLCNNMTPEKQCLDSVENSKDELYSGFMIEIFDKMASEKTYKQRVAKVIPLINRYNPQADALLELACGTGNFTKQLAKEDFNILATDISKDEIKKAKTKDINARFKVADMSKLQAYNKFDIICCFWESFRYLPSYQTAELTLKRVCKALNNGGLFLVDFSFFPPNIQPFRLPTITINLGNGLLVYKQTSLLTKGDYDTRWDDIQYKLSGKDITGQKVKWQNKTIYLKPKLYRASLLRIPRNIMEEMLMKTGFEILEVCYGFSECPESMLFVAQKKMK